MAILAAYHFTHRTIHRNGVAQWSHGAEVITTIGVGAEIGAQIHHLGSILCLQVVEAVLAGLPYLHQRIRDRRAFIVRYVAIERDFPHRWLGDDAGTERQLWRAFAIERAEQAALRPKLACLLVMHSVDQRTDTQHISK